MRRLPMSSFRNALIAVVLGVTAAVGTAELATRLDPAPAASEQLALFTSLPIYWSEAGDVAGMLQGDSPPHWARTALERDWRLMPLDVLDSRGGLSGQRRLLMIQPRPLSPEENVSLDDWLTSGGHLLLFADPALTAESAFALGDRRRPQDVVLLSPILSRWGLELRFDEEQALADRTIALGEDTVLPVRLAGSFAVRPQGNAARCRLSAEGIVASCRIGKGALVAVADAALFEPVAGDSDERRRRAALHALTAAAFRR